MAGFGIRNQQPYKPLIKLLATLLGTENTFKETTEDTLSKFDSVQRIGF